MCPRFFESIHGESCFTESVFRQKKIVVAAKESKFAMDFQHFIDVYEYTQSTLMMKQKNSFFDS